MIYVRYFRRIQSGDALSNYFFFDCHNMKYRPFSLLIQYVLPIMFGLLGLHAFSQSPSYLAYTTREGLAQNQVTAFFQDDKGYLWIGTKAGLSRFDGLEFQNFYIADGLPENHVCAITQSTGGDIYVLTRSGFAVWDGTDFHSYPHPDGSVFQYWTTYVNPHLASHLEDGWVFISAAHDQTVLFKDGAYFDADTLFPGISGYGFISHRFSDDGKRLLFRCRYKRELLIYENGSASPFYGGLNGYLVNSTEGHVVCISADSIFLLDRERFSITDRFFYDKEKWGEIVLFLSKYEYYSIKDQKYFTAHKKGAWQRYAFSIPMINGMYEDKEGTTWITGEGGVLRILSEEFISLGPSAGAPVYPWTVIEEPGKGLWVASYGEGLFFYNGDYFKKTKVSYPADNPYNDNFYMGSTRDRHGNIWLPHSFGVVKIENGNARLMEGIPPLFNLLAHEHPENKSMILVHVDSFTVIDTLGNIQTHALQPGNKQGIMVSAQTDKKGNTWFGNVAGISLWDGEMIIHLPTPEIPFDKGAVTMARDHRGNMWLGNSQGLYFYDYRDSVVRIAPALINQQVKDLQVMDARGLFIGMIGKIGYLDLNTFYSSGNAEVIFYDEDKGFPGLEVQQNGSNLAADGSLWFCTHGHIVNFDPRRADAPQLLTRHAIISGVSFLSRENKWEALPMDTHNPIVLDHWQNNIRFFFKGITTVRPQAVRYRYKIAGLDDAWSEGISERFVSYTYLPAGKYTFLLDMTMHNGEWSEAPIELKFMIRQAWWQTPLFRWSLLLFIVSMLVWLALRVNNMRRRARWKRIISEKRLAELRLEAVRSQSNPHFMFNLLNSMALSVLKGERQQAYDLLITYSRLIRKVFHKNEVPYANLEEEISFTADYLNLQRLRYKDAFDYEIIVDENTGYSTLLPRLFLQTLAENALKHGILPGKGKGRIIIKVKRENSAVIVEVEDNGIGREKASEARNESTGKGLHIARQLFDILNEYNQEKLQFYIEDLNSDNGTALGTRVKVIIPDGFRYEIKPGLKETGKRK